MGAVRRRGTRSRNPERIRSTGKAAGPDPLGNVSSSATSKRTGSIDAHPHPSSVRPNLATHSRTTHQSELRGCFAAPPCSTPNGEGPGLTPTNNQIVCCVLVRQLLSPAAGQHTICQSSRATLRRLRNLKHLQDQVLGIRPGHPHKPWRDCKWTNRLYIPMANMSFSLCEAWQTLFADWGDRRLRWWWAVRGLERTPTVVRKAALSKHGSAAPPYERA